ncbi:MAG: hypothetical protein ACUVTZ_11905, partial [Armatimonadota bacterium]
TSVGRWFYACRVLWVSIPLAGFSLLRLDHPTADEDLLLSGFNPAGGVLFVATATLSLAVFGLLVNALAARKVTSVLVGFMQGC